MSIYIYEELRDVFATVNYLLISRKGLKIELFLIGIKKMHLVHLIKCVIIHLPDVIHCIQKYIPVSK